MKIHQKLTLSFFGTSLLLGFLGFLSWRINVGIEHDSERVIQESLIEIKASEEMLYSLQEIQTASQELLLDKDNESDSNKSRVQKEIVRAYQVIQNNIANFDQNFLVAKDSSLNSTINSNHLLEKEEKQSEKLDLKSLEKIQKEFLIYQNLVNNYLVLTNENPEEAYIFLETKLEPQVRNVLLPLVKAYKDDSLEEMKSEATKIKNSASQDDLLILVFSLISIFISLGLGTMLSDYIRKTTVSKSYVDNILTSMNDSMIVINLDGTIEKVNEATLNLLGYQEDELITQSIGLVLADKSLKIKPLVPQDFLGNRETVYVTKDDRKIAVAFSSSFILDEQGHARGIVCVAKDITEKCLAERALKESEERYALASLAANDGLWDWNLKTNQIYFSPRWKFLLGYEEQSLGNTPDEWFKRVHPDYLEELSQAIMAHLQNPISNFELNYQMLHADGSYRWMLCRGIAVKDEQGKIYRLTGSQTDITQSQVAVEQLRHDALHDKLTGLPNRAFLLEKLEKLLKLSKQQPDYLFAVVFIDLDRFKVINDSMGHLVGDQLLVEFTKRIESCLRHENTFARLGGDEFTIVVEGIQELGDATKIAQRIQSQLEQPFKLQAQEVFVTASIGIAPSTNNYKQVEELLRDADTAMYQAKAKGKARYIVFEPNMHLDAVTTLELENDLRRAIERQEFQLFYQPIVQLSNRKVIGFEALLRWQHPEKGLISPEKFIPLAEETGLIVPIGWWVMEQASRQMRQWQEKYEVASSMAVSINVSPRQLEGIDISNCIKKILEKTALSPGCLRLEITESTIIDNIDQTVSLFTQLKALGIKLSMDDFGTGYSSLSYLNRLPIDTLKIDRSFVNKLEKEPENIKLIQTIVNLAKNMQVNVIAEGVETSDQLIQLKELNCEYGQGYLFSKPVSADGAEILITTMEQFTKLTSVNLFNDSYVKI
ncbi:MAG: EAL domain-containing protein [Prochloraceae cyanobacterium]|nr:EAL domain-containing protein [Prochloraceae cyanobacterium]